MAYTNSSLVTYKKISPNKTSPRNHEIDCITIHCMVARWTAKQACDYFAQPSVECAPNYAVGKDGSIGLSVEEKDRSWCTSSSSNDNRAITIEVASDTTHPYAVTDKALSALIELIADICKRNNIKELKWKGDKSLIGQIDKQNMTVHRWFANKACPGDYLYNKHSYIAEQVNKKLGVTTEIYRIRKTWADASSQIGAYSSLEGAKSECKAGYSVFDSKGNVVYSISAPAKTSTFLPSRGYFKKGDKGKNVEKINDFYYNVFPSYASALKRNKENVKGNLFGENTEAWTKEFQRRTGLEPDGFIGKITLAELKKYGFKE